MEGHKKRVNIGVVTDLLPLTLLRKTTMDKDQNDENNSMQMAPYTHAKMSGLSPVRTLYTGIGRVWGVTGQSEDRIPTGQRRSQDHINYLKY